MTSAVPVRALSVQAIGMRRKMQQRESYALVISLERFTMVDASVLPMLASKMQQTFMLS